MPVASDSSNATGIFVSMSTRSKESRSTAKRKPSAGPIAFFVALFIVALGLIQLVSTFHTYALSLSELNGLKKQEASLVAQKRELENDIARWDDDAYVTAQARERLGYVFPGEQAIRVEHPEAVTGERAAQKDDAEEHANESKLPWYSELAYAFGEADAEQDGARRTDGAPADRSGQDGATDGADPAAP